MQFYAKKGVELGYKTIVLQSGEDLYYDVDKICYIIREIKKLNLALTLSIGERSFDDYKAFFDSLDKSGYDKGNVSLEGFFGDDFNSFAKRELRLRL